MRIVELACDRLGVVHAILVSHSHFDHAAGGAVFADTAKFVAHENMLRNMDGRYPHMPGDMIDRNHNGAIDPGETLVVLGSALRFSQPFVIVLLAMLADLLLSFVRRARRTRRAAAPEPISRHAPV